MGNLVSDLCDLLLLQGFANLYKLVRIAFGDGFVQVANSAQAHNVLPAVLFLKDFEHLVLTDERFQF